MDIKPTKFFAFKIAPKLDYGPNIVSFRAFFIKFVQKNKLNVPESRPLADFLPTITITAKNLATEITNFNVKKEDIQGETHITKKHITILMSANFLLKVILNLNNYLLKKTLKNLNEK